MIIVIVLFCFDLKVYLLIYFCKLHCVYVHTLFHSCNFSVVFRKQHVFPLLSLVVVNC